MTAESEGNDLVTTFTHEFTLRQIGPFMLIIRDSQVGPFPAELTKARDARFRKDVTDR